MARAAGVNESAMGLLNIKTCEMKVRGACTERSSATTSWESSSWRCAVVLPPKAPRCRTSAEDKRSLVRCSVVQRPPPVHRSTPVRAQHAR